VDTGLASVPSSLAVTGIQLQQKGSGKNPERNRMKAVVYYDYGSPDVLRWEEISKPTAGNDGVVVKVHAASVNPLDWKVMGGGPYIVRKLLGLGKRKIKRPGVDVAGQVEAVGTNVTEFKPGDEVFGTCRGAFAEYACTSESASVLKSVLLMKPANVTFEQAACAPIAGLTALQSLRDKGRIRPGQKVLVNGAAGGVGTFAVQIAKSFGAEVTGVCSTRNVDMVRSIGADRIIDYTKDDFTKSGQHYDLFIECVGSQSLSECRRVLKPNGICVLVGAPSNASLTVVLGRFIGALASSLFLSKKLVPLLARSNKEDLAIIGELMATGKVQPIIDRRYTLTEVPEALRYLKEGHARGKVVITFEGNDQA
jgi:NADPH:quinone reductase-like Zn-dependent oxidoreductase